MRLLDCETERSIPNCRPQSLYVLRNLEHSSCTAAEPQYRRAAWIGSPDPLQLSLGMTGALSVNDLGNCMMHCWIGQIRLGLQTKCLVPLSLQYMCDDGDEIFTKSTRYDISVMWCQRDYELRQKVMRVLLILYVKCKWCFFPCEFSAGHSTTY